MNWSCLVVQVSAYTETSSILLILAFCTYILIQHIRRIYVYLYIDSIYTYIYNMYLYDMCDRCSRNSCCIFLEIPNLTKLFFHFAKFLCKNSAIFRQCTNYAKFCTLEINHYFTPNLCITEENRYITYKKREKPENLVFFHCLNKKFSFCNLFVIYA